MPHHLFPSGTPGGSLRHATKRATGFLQEAIRTLPLVNKLVIVLYFRAPNYQDQVMKTDLRQGKGQSKRLRFMNTYVYLEHANCNSLDLHHNVRFTSAYLHIGKAFN